MHNLGSSCGNYDKTVNGMGVITPMTKSEKVTILLLNSINQLSTKPVTKKTLKGAKDIIAAIEELIDSEE